MSYSIESNRGFYGPENDPDEEHVSVSVYDEFIRAVFKKYHDGERVEYSLEAPTDMSNNEYIRMISDFDEVFPDSTVNLMPDFPIVEGSYDQIELTFYQVRSEEERNRHAVVETGIGGEETTGWIIWSNENRNDNDFKRKIKLISKEYDPELFGNVLDSLEWEDHLGLQRNEVGELIGTVEEELKQTDFQYF